jgi:hypothetical protein
MPRTRITLAAVCAASLALPAAAGAAELQVGPAAEHTTIKSAITAARLTAEADTITIAPGVYAEGVELLDAKDAGLTIVGAGDGTDPAKDTIIRPRINWYTVFSAYHRVTLRRVRLEHPSTPGDGGVRRAAGANLYGDGSVVEDVTVSIVTDESQDWGFDLRDGAHTLRDVHVDAGHGLAVYAQNAALTIEDSTLRGDGGGAEDRSSAPAARVTLRRTRVAAAPSAEAAVRAQAPLTIDSSLITGGQFGVDLRNGDGAGSELLVHGSTLDPGVAGADTEPNSEGTPIHAVSLGGGQGLVDSSIVYDALGSWDGVAGELRCEYSAVTHTVHARVTDEHGAVACPVGAQGNIAVGAALHGADYVLTPDSAARDAGRPGTLAAGASATDAAGRARIAQPAGCAGRLDMGAFESDARPCPPVDAPAPGPGTCAAAAPPCVPADTTTPRVRGLKLRRGKLRGTLSEGATVAITVQRCKGKRCVRVARLRRTLPAGAFSLRLPAKARKRAGRYVVAVRAVDAAGNAGSATLRFTRRR